LQENNFTGSVPNSLFSLGSLRTLRLDGNEISGSISSAIGQLQNLMELYLGSSKMGGMLPDSLYQLPKLEILDLSSAAFQDTVSSNVAFLNDTLKSLILNDNQFFGPIPESLGQFGKLGKR